MNLKKLPKHEHYYHTHADFFKNNLDLTRVFLMPDYEIGMHEQEFYEINLITKGKGIHYLGESHIQAKKGDVFIIPPNHSHGYVGGAGFDVFHVIISDAFMSKNMVDLQQLPSFFTLFGAEPLMRGKTQTSLNLSLSESSFNSVIALLMSVSEYTSETDPFECLKRNSLTMVIISALCEAYQKQVNPSRQIMPEDQSFMQSISYIHEYFYKKITINDLAEIAHLSRTAYINQFKSICKMPPSTYITKLRVDSAMNMLTNTGLSISEIAYRTGFYDSSHFIKIFEGLIKTTPQEYRNLKNKS